MEDFDYKKLEVVFEDNHIIVVVKPQNIPSQGDASNDKDMLSIVKDYLVDKYNKPGEAYVGLIHRLDRPTGGVMVFAKTSKAAQRLCEEIKNGEFSKKYLCVCCGEPKDKNATLVNYLKKNQAKNIVNVVPMMTEDAQRAELEYSVIDTIQGFSLVKVHLITGRSHQIRVQMAAIGCPLFGDQKYGADSKTFKHNLGLWSTEIRLVHPVTKENMTFIVHPPKEEVPWKAYDISRFLNVGLAVSPYEIINDMKNQIDEKNTDRKENFKRKRYNNY
ncbi:MAG: RNA pseudouridine synthase [Clostridia bacterium]